MNHERVRWSDIHSVKNGVRKSNFKTYCELIDSCEVCNPKIRFLCKIKNKIENIQTEIIRKELNNRPE